MRIAKEQARARIKAGARALPVGGVVYNIAFSDAYTNVFMSMAERAQKFRLVSSAQALVEGTVEDSQKRTRGARNRFERQRNMIPITDNTVTAVAALIYNYAYEQDPDTGWLASDEHSAPAHEPAWLEWSARLLQTLSAAPEATDEQILNQAAKRVDTGKAGHGWNMIWMQQTEEGDEYSTITEQTDLILPIVRHFLEEPGSYTEVSFLESDPAYLAYLEAPIVK